MTECVTRNCLECGELVTEKYKRTCSDQCRDIRAKRKMQIHDAKRRPLRIRTLSCKLCAVEFDAIGPGPRAYCDEHQRYETRRGKRQYNPGNSRRYSLKHQYGLTPQAWDELLAEQGGVCANKSCGRGDGLHVDHDHSCCPGERTCGKCIRGLLCGGCNKAAGLLRDNPDVIRGLADYLGWSTTKKEYTHA